MFKQSKLKSGLKLIYAPVKSKAVTLLVMVRVGSKYESDNIAGLSHFLEHMFFKGTSRRPNTKAISEYLDEIGGEYNAFTSKEYTGFYAKVATEHVERAFDFISDILLNSKFQKEEMEKEKGVIIEEMNMYQDTPMAYIGEKFEELLYRGQSAGRLVIGNKKSILSMTRPKFVKYYNDHYLASKSVLCLAGNIGESKFKNLSERYFKNIKSGKAKDKIKVIDKQSSSKLLLMNKNTDQTHFCLGFRAYDIFDKRRYALRLLSAILGESMSSRLFLEVREKLGLAYYIRSSMENYTDSGYFVVQAGVDSKKVEKAIRACLAEFKKVLKKGISKEELKKSKEYFRGKMIMGLETSDELASFLTTQEILTRKIKTEKEIFENIEKVKAGEIMDVAQDIFSNNKLNLALIGPHKNENKFKKILKL